MNIAVKTPTRRTEDSGRGDEIEASFPATIKQQSRLTVRVSH